MKTICAQLKSRDIDVFLFSPQETAVLMASETSKSNQRLLSLERRMDDQTEKIDGFQVDLNNLNVTVQSLRDNAVTSWQVITRVLLPLMGTVVAAALAVYFGLSNQLNTNYSERLPKDIEFGISSSPYLEDKFGGVDGRFTKIDQKLEEISRTLGLFANTAAVSAAILDATDVPKDQLAKSIPKMRRLLEFAKNSRTPLSSDTYKRASKMLFTHYASSAQPLKNELWNILAYTASTRTSTDVAHAPIAESKIDQAKAAGNFFEGNVDLSQKTEWTDTIFKNATITISKPQNELVLDGVRFIDCDFQSVSEDESNQKLFQSLLAAPKPELSVAINSYRVLPPRFSDPSPVRKTDPV